MANGHGGARPNAGGARPHAGRKPKAITTIRQKALEEASGDAERALAFVIAIMDDEGQPVRLRKECSVEVMDRVWGKAKQTSEVTGKDGGPMLLRWINDWRRPDAEIPDAE